MKLYAKIDGKEQLISKVIVKTADDTASIVPVGFITSLRIDTDVHK